MSDRIDRNYGSHLLDEEQQKRVAEIREGAKTLAQRITDEVPASREQSLALTKLEEVVFWSTAGIARPPEEKR